MPIVFNCTCGKKLQARDELAGKRLKCPGCHTVLPVPQRSLSEATSTTASDARRPVPGPPLAKPVLAGRASGALPPLPNVPDFPEEDDIPSPFAPRTVVSSVNPWVDRSLEQQSTPWQGDDRERLNQGMKFREGPSLLLTLLVLAVVCGLAFGAVYFLLQSEEGPANRRAKSAKGDDRKLQGNGSIQGKVIYKGRPVNPGTVVFHSLFDEAFPQLTKADGSYHLMNVPPGRYKVSVNSVSFQSPPVKGPKGKGIGPGKGAGGPMIKLMPVPRRYTNAQTSGLAFEVKPGDQTFDIELKD